METLVPPITILTKRREAIPAQSAAVWIFREPAWKILNPARR